MPPKGKVKARAFKSPSTVTKPSAPSGDPPAPFKVAPTNLEGFLSKLNKKHVYITHIDTHQRDFKRKIFLVPLAMNFAIIGLLAWRIRAVHDFYFKICFSLMGKNNEMTIDIATTPFDDLVREIVRRAMVFIIDLLIYVFVWPWPRDFFAGRTIGNPVAWRFAVGFRDKEIIVRRSRKWDLGIGSALEKSDGQAMLFEMIRKAVDPIWMNEKTGYLMLNNEWDLDWKLIIKATKLVDKKVLTLDDFRTTIFVHDPEFGWMIIDTGNASGSAKEEEGRRKIVAFKDELTALGKENLFFRWIELVQFESSQPGGFGPEQQQKTMLKAKEMFESQGVDFDAFWTKVGGMQGMPGMDQL